MKKYVFKPYSSQYNELFEKEKNRIAAVLKGPAQIEHVGSSAIPGLGGKGIIDIAVATKSKEEIADDLLILGYEFCLGFSSEERFFFKITLPDLQEGQRVYHVHVMEPKSPEFENMIFFKDYLTTHPVEAKEYEKLKKKAALASHEEGRIYRQLKEPFIQKVLKKKQASF